MQEPGCENGAAVAALFSGLLGLWCHHARAITLVAFTALAPAMNAACMSTMITACSVVAFSWEAWKKMIGSCDWI